jgi:Fe-Mn family superoxide dismutase
LKGFSDQILKDHLALYQGYVRNTNQLATVLLEMDRKGKSGTPTYAELKRRFGWEFNGMRLHELYFENLAKRLSSLRKQSPLGEQLLLGFGRLDTWERGFMSTGGMRGIGWVVLALDPAMGQLFNVWVDEHDSGVLAGAVPLLVMDVFEHAYLRDYGLNRTAYVQAFMKAINWPVVEQRFATFRQHPGQIAAVRRRAS